ncbi:hypothetical protein [Peptoniphilus timonensis]|uniref:hypothetical protein n=1 Tax=Peptoniphilus timonensis TaxID=1268254 RepID=UPI0002DBC790|nr:hypothetical protein [Peptoniphilus timonensis]
MTKTINKKYNKNLYLDFKYSFNDFNNLIGGAVYALINLDDFFNESGFIKLRFLDTEGLIKNKARLEKIDEVFYLFYIDDSLFIGREVLEENFVMCFIKGTDAYMNALKSRAYKELIYSNTVPKLINILSNQDLPMHNVIRNKFNRSVVNCKNKKVIGYVMP